MTGELSGDGRSAPLAGLSVLDVSSVLSGPLTTQLLAEMGADVIKVENPAAPDFTRTTGNARNGMTAYFYGINRGKRSLALDGRSPDGQDVLQRLADRVDVVVQNMRPGKAARIGLDPDECLRRNPSLVYASISGYGADGPASGEPVYDYVIQAVTGMVDLQRDPTTGRPDLARHFPADKVTSHATVEAILAALFARERDPERRGQHVEISMHEANLAFFFTDGMMQHTLVGDPDHTEPYPGDLYRVYPTTDGAIVLMPLMGPFDGVCNAVGRPEWIGDPRWADPKTGDLLGFQDLLAAEVEQLSTADALAAFARYDVPAGPVMPIGETHTHEQAVARASVREVDAATIGPIRVARPPWRFATTPELLLDDAPDLGQHTTQILTELDYTPTEITRLQEAAVIHTPLIPDQTPPGGTTAHPRLAAPPALGQSAWWRRRDAPMQRRAAGRWPDLRVAAPRCAHATSCRRHGERRVAAPACNHAPLRRQAWTKPGIGGVMVC